MNKTKSEFWSRRESNRSLLTRIVQMVLCFSIVFGATQLCAQLNFPGIDKLTADDWVDENLPGETFRQEDAGFGTSVSMGEQWALVGAPYENVMVDGSLFLDAGAVYLYLFSEAENQWAVKARLTSPVPEPDGNFGFSVSIEDAHAVIGQPSENDRGKAFFYSVDINGLTHLDQIVLQGSELGGRFGHSVDTSERPGATKGWLVIGEPHAGQSNEGRVDYYYISYTAGTVNHHSWVVGIEGEPGKLGYSVSIAAGEDEGVGPEILPVSLLGAPFFSNENADAPWLVHNTGEAFIVNHASLDEVEYEIGSQDLFDDGGLIYTSLQKDDVEEQYINSELDEGGQFGHSVSLDETVTISGWAAVIGAPMLGANDAGGAFVILRNQGVWSPSIRFSQDDPTENRRFRIVPQAALADDNSQFGFAVSSYWKHMYIGAPNQDLTLSPQSDSNEKDAGVVYRYTWTSGALSTFDNGVEYEANDRQEDDHFGRSVSVWGLYRDPMVGAPDEDHSSLATETEPGLGDISGSGSAYFDFLSDSCIVEWIGVPFPGSVFECGDPILDNVMAEIGGTAVVVSSSSEPESNCLIPDADYCETWSWRVECADGSLRVESSTIGFIDDTPPSITGFASEITLECGADPVALITASLTDNCSSDIGLSETVVTDGNTSVYTYSIDDGNGNSATYVQTVDFLCDEPCLDAVEIVPSIFGETAWETFTLNSAGVSELSTCGGDADDAIWFSFVAQSTNDFIIAQDASGTGGYDVVIEFTDECPSMATPFCYNNYGAGAMERAIPGDLIVGHTYYYRVYDAAPGASASQSVITQVKTFADCTLIVGDCGIQNVQLTESITALNNSDDHRLYVNPNVFVQQHEFLFVNPDPAGFQPDPVVSGAELQLDQVPGLEHGVTYTVTVRHSLNTVANGLGVEEYWSEYGSPCTVQIACTPFPSSQLNATSCGATDLYLSDLLQAYQIPGAEQYHFRFTYNNEPPIDKFSNVYGFWLHTAAGLTYGREYSVIVRVKMNGVWSSWGCECTMTMADAPQIVQVQQAFCDGEYQVDYSDHILATQTFGAQQYMWEFTSLDPITGAATGTATYTTGGLSLFFHSDGSAITEGQYSVAVKVLAGNVWTDYGPPCLINMISNGSVVSPGASNMHLLQKSMDSTSLLGELFPNPNDGGQFYVNLKGLGQEHIVVQLEIYDLVGKRLHAEQVSITGSESLFLINPDEALSTGSYFISVQAGDQRLQLPMVVQ